MPRPILVILLLALAPGFATAVANRVLNPDFEAGSGVGPIPAWSADGSHAYRAPLLGESQSSGALLVGIATLRSANAFGVAGGESLVFEADVWEARDDADDRTTVVRGDSVAVLTFRDPSGIAPLTLEFHCDAYVDLLDDGALDGSDTCTASDGYVSMTVPNGAIGCGTSPLPECLKYRQALVVPATATRASVALGGSIARDGTPDGPGVTTPTSLTLFDNIVVGN